MSKCHIVGNHMHWLNYFNSYGLVSVMFPLLEAVSIMFPLHFPVQILLKRNQLTAQLLVLFFILLNQIGNHIVIS